MVFSINDVLAYSMTLSQLTLLQDKMSLFVNLWENQWIRWLIYTNIFLTSVRYVQTRSVVDSTREMMIKHFYKYTRDVSRAGYNKYFHQFFHKFEINEGDEVALGLVPIPHGYMRGYITKETVTVNDKTNTKNVYSLLLYVKSIEDYNEVIKAAADHIDREATRHYRVYNSKTGGSEATPIGVIKHPKISWFDSIFFEGKQEFIQYLKEYVTCTGRFDPEFNPTRKAVVLLYGPPGNGKTSLIRAIQQYLEEHGDRRDIQINRPSQFNPRTVFSTASRSKISVFEDVTDDGYEVFFDDEFKKNAGGRGDTGDVIFKMDGTKLTAAPSTEKVSADEMTLTAWLNFFDGLVPLTDSFFILTTNNPEYLHRAFRRPGRVTYKILMDNPGLKQAEEIFNSCYRRKPTADECTMLKQIVEKNYCAARLKYSMSAPEPPSTMLQFLLDGTDPSALFEFDSSTTNDTTAKTKANNDADDADADADADADVVSA